MTPFWIRTAEEVQLAIVPRPRGGDWHEQELLAIQRAGVDVLISLLTPGEQLELGLDAEQEVCERIGLQFRSFPIPDRGTPESLRSFKQFVDDLDREIQEGRSIATHCRASIGRASLVLASLLCQRNMTAQRAFSSIAIARGSPVPDTHEQVRWVKRFSEYASVSRD